MRVWVNGKEQELYTIGHVAKLLKRSVETLRAWERDQTIPKPMFKFRNNVRLYHPKEVEVMKGVLKKQGKYAYKDELRKAMWEKLATVRKEIIEQSKS